MASTAKTPDALTKRVQRFLSRERNKDKLLSRLLNLLGDRPNVYLFGGALRDIALYGIAKIDADSDIDLVHAESQAPIRPATLKDFQFSINKFGGFRIKTDRRSVDLWNAENTWAFQKGHRKYERVESLLDTTITNWESILYNLKKHKLIFKENYFGELDERYLDVVLDKNPNPLGMYVRIMRAYACKEKLELSNRETQLKLSNQASQLMRKALKKHTFDEMSIYEKEHFQKSYIDKLTYDHINKHTQSTDLLPVPLENIKRPRLV